MPRSNSGSKRVTRSRTSASNPASAPTTRSRRPPANRSSRVYGYQISALTRNSTVFLPFSEGSNDMIADNDSSDRSDSPPPYSLLPPQNNLSAIVETTTDPVITAIASSLKSSGPFSVTTLVPSSAINRNFINNCKGRAYDGQKMFIYSYPLTTATTDRSKNGAIQQLSASIPLSANIGSINRPSTDFRIHLAAASNFRSYTPYDHSKKLNAIEELSGIGNTSSILLTWFC
ncbi:hypothetical protein AYI70_g2979 [Smittium culicis]|uniref:Uncharacterized protein n=1 Tax=Smittium culicis TaxID=133412 RepID=A0A1R1Y5U2_9FUNG|nr:hypothetical protein AYI70_g2979 [Smittium culicis]